MHDLGIIDRFMEIFIRYIDSGFGLLGPDVAFLSTMLIGIDITLAGLFWAMGADDEVLFKLVRKILFVGAFAFILNQFPALAEIVFRSFAGLGLTAGGGGLSADDLLRPGKLAATGFEAAWPLLKQVEKLLGFTEFFTNFPTISALMFAWAIVLLAFFILAIQLFVTIIEFKLTTLAGFVLVPFALWNRTAFLAERVLGNVVSSGIKVMVLAVIVGIGSGFFADFVTALHGQEPDIAQAMSLVLASLALLGLGIFGPTIASGLVSGAPQLGAGAAIGTTVAAAGAAAVGGGAAMTAARGIGGGALAAMRAGTSMGSAASTAYALGQESSGSASVGAGIKGVGQAAAGAAKASVKQATGFAAAVDRGRNAAWSALNPTEGTPAAARSDGVPAWARDMRAEQSSRHRRQLAIHALGSGDHGGAGAHPDISEKD